jgi:hypothetical protein
VTSDRWDRRERREHKAPKVCLAHWVLRARKGPRNHKGQPGLKV